MNIEKDDIYLGDGLYVNYDGYLVVLFTHNGISQTNRVCLEPEVLNNFLAYAKRVKEGKKI